MANTYYWEFPALQVYTQHGGESNVVYTVHWIYNAVNETGEYRTNIFGAQQIAPYVSGSPFIPFDLLTKEEVENWMMGSIGSGSISNMQQQLDQKIQDLINPPVAMKTPPWMATPTSTPTQTVPVPTPTPTLTETLPEPTPTSTPVETFPEPTPTPALTETLPEPTPTPSSVE